MLSITPALKVSVLPHSAATVASPTDSNPTQTRPGPWGWVAGVRYSAPVTLQSGFSRGQTNMAPGCGSASIWGAHSAGAAGKTAPVGYSPRKAGRRHLPSA